MTNSSTDGCRQLGLRRKSIFMAVLIAYSLVLFSIAHYLKINVKTAQGNPTLQGSVNSGETGEQSTTKIREIRGVKSVKSLLKTKRKGKQSQAAL